MSKPLSERYDYILLLAGLSGLTALAIDIALPATGAVARGLGVPENMGALLVGVYFLAFAVGQLFWGLLSDVFGRKRVLQISMVLFVLASVGCALSSNFWVLIGFRALQGLAGGAPVIARAIVRDISSGTEAAKMLSVLMAVSAIAPMVAPIIGAGLLEFAAWPSVFVFLAVFGGVLLVFGQMTLQKTVIPAHPDRLSFKFISKACRFLFTQRDFLVGVGIGALTFGGYASILSLGAVVTEERYAVSPAMFSWLFALGAIFLLLGTLVVRALLGRLGMRILVTWSVFAVGMATVVNVAILFISPSLVMFWGGICVYTFAFGMILPTSSALAMEPTGEMPGFASSMLGSVQMAVGAVGAGLSSVLYNGTHSAISGTMVIFGTLTVGCFLVARFYDRKNAA